MKNIGVIGAGVMGSGVALCFAQAGHRVVLIDISEEILQNAKNEIYKSLRFQAFFKKDKNMEAYENIIERIVFATDYQMLADADFIVENVTEKWDVKKEVYKLIDEICPEESIFAVNTSCISITRIASLTNRPDRIIGTHFMNPVPMKAVVECVKGYHTSEKTVEATRALLSNIGKEIIVVNDYPGFVTNRVLMLTVNEAIYVVQDQVACPEDVDRIFKTCFDHKMGPLETADLIGLDTILYSIEALYESYNDSKYRPCPLLKKMVDAGLYGMKSGQGFYEYKNKY